MAHASGPVRVRLECTVDELRQLVAATRVLEDRRPLISMDGTRRLCVSPVQLDQQLSLEAPPGPSIDSPDNTILAEPELVSDGSGDVNRRASDSPPTQGPVDIGSRGDPPVDTEQQHPPGRMEALRNSFEEQGLSKSVGDLILEGNRPATRAAYQSAFNVWRNWCIPRDINPLSCSVNETLEFLADQFKEGKAASTINVYRSMLSTTFGQKGGDPLGSHPQVSSLMAGVYNSRPPTPRYSDTWNPDRVLMFIKNTVPASLIEHAEKLATLLALTTLRRCGELASISLPSVSYSPRGVTFTFLKPLKAQHSGSTKSITIGEWLEDPSICPVSSIKDYINASQSLRKEANSSSLFISSTKPHGAVTGSTVGRWIKSVLQKSGIDTSTFKPHSTRSAAASKAADKGVHMQAILERGHWAKTSTFSRFYHRSVPNSNVEDSILSI